MLTLTPAPERTEALNRAAIVSAVFATVLAPIHALARYATEDGKEDLELAGVKVWAEPARDAFEPLLDWASPDTVYVTYGKLFFPVLVIALLVALTVRARREPATGAEKWGWRIAVPGYVLLAVATFGEYWTPFLDEFFALAAIPGLLISLVGSTVLGIGLLRRGYRPRSTALLLTLWIPAVVVLSSVIALGAALLPMVWAWALSGRAVSTPG